MRSQADRDEVTLDIAAALGAGVAFGVFAGLVAWVFSAVPPGPVDWDWVVSCALVVAVVGTLARLTGRARWSKRSR